MVLLDPQTWLTSQDPLRVVALRDPAVEAVGHEPRSRYVEVFYLGILGPAAVVAARHLAGRLEASPEGFAVPPAVLARQLGLGTGTGRNAALTKTLARLARFGLAAVGDDAYALRLAFPPLARRHLRRLPPHLVVAHELMRDGAVIKRVVTAETLRC
jgi:hypothetical protein